MKVLFAVSSESISDAIIKRYQKEYKEILSYKNVYYFNAILKEIQKDKSYDRIVISEDLEPFSNNNYDSIDKFIFEKLDNISDEAHDNQGKETSIILICTDRHTKGSSFLVKLFGIGVYNALLGNDRSMDQVCKLINQPRVKKEAKMYYKIDAEDVSYDPTSEKEVSELEIQNILNHFKKISKNKDKYADSFNNIASQYSDEQLKIIINCLPIGVKAILEEECPKYQELMSANIIQSVGGRASLQAKEDARKTGIKIDILESKLSQPKMTGPIVIPSSVKTSGKKGPVKVRQVDSSEELKEQASEKKVVKKILHNPVVQEESKEEELDFDNLLSDIDDVENNLISKPNNNEKIDTVLDNDDLLLSFDDEQEDDSLLINSDDKNEEDDDLLVSFDDEQEDDSLLINSDDENEEDDDLLLSFDDEQEDDSLLVNSDDENEEDDGLLVALDEDMDDDIELDEDETDNLLIETENETDVDELLMSLDDDENLLESFEDDEKVTESNSELVHNENRTIKRGRGRPRKNPIPTEPKPKGKRGRPRKNPVSVETEQELEEDSIDLIMDSDENEEKSVLSPDMFLNQEDEELVMPVDDETTEDDDLLLINSDDEANEADDLLISLDEDLDDSLEVVENEEETDEINLSEIDDLDDIEDYQEDNEEDDNLDILTGMDYEEIDEDDYLVTGNSNKEDEDSLLMTLDEEETENDSVDSLLINSIDEIEDNNEEDELISSVSSDFSDNLNSLDNLEDDEPILNQSYNNYKNEATNRVESIKPQVDYSMSTLNSLLTKDKKIVTFIGTTKNGTSFLINNLAALFASLGINTAILDMTKNRNSYYIYTKNEEELRKIAYTSIDKLENGFAEGIKVDKNLTVYTALPNNGKSYTNAEPILSTLVQNHSLVLIDCDFDTDPSYFASCQEIYLVQSMDILTIQPLTSFLRDLKAKGVLEAEKVRVVINKEIKVRSLTTKIIIGGMSFYNDPAMAFMTELFNKDMVKACSIPFEDVTYSKYLDAMVNCNVSLNGYSKAFLSKLRILGDMVYPLTSKQTYSKPMQNYNKNAFSSSMNNTLNQMKNKF